MSIFVIMPRICSQRLVEFANNLAIGNCLINLTSCDTSTVRLINFLHPDRHYLFICNMDADELIQKYFREYLTHLLCLTYCLR